MMPEVTISVHSQVYVAMSWGGGYFIGLTNETLSDDDIANPQSYDSLEAAKAAAHKKYGDSLIWTEGDQPDGCAGVVARGRPSLSGWPLAKVWAECDWENYEREARLRDEKKLEILELSVEHVEESVNELEALYGWEPTVFPAHDCTRVLVRNFGRYNVGPESARIREIHYPTVMTREELETELELGSRDDLGCWKAGD